MTTPPIICQLNKEGTVSVSDNKTLISRYLDAINGKEKPAAVVDQFISEADALLKQQLGAQS